MTYHVDQDKVKTITTKRFGKITKMQISKNTGLSANTIYSLFSKKHKAKEKNLQLLADFLWVHRTEIIVLQ